MEGTAQEIAKQLQDRHALPAAQPVAPPDSTTALVDAMHAAPPEAVRKMGANMGAASSATGGAAGAALDSGPGFDFSDPHADQRARESAGHAMAKYNDPGAFDTAPPPPPNPIGPNGVPTSIAAPAAPVATDSSVPDAQVPMQGQMPASIPGQLQGIDAQTRQVGATNTGDIEQAKQLALQGAQEKAAADRESASLAAPMLAKKVEIEQHAGELTKRAEDWMQEQAAQERNHTFEMRDRLMAEAARDPTNLWGNWSTSQKIGGIIGIIAAGFAHQDATARVEHLVDQSVADSNRRMENLHAISQQDREIAASNDRVYGSKMNAANSEKASKLEIIAKQMEQTANTMANPIAKANLLTTSAGIMSSVVKLRDDVAKTTLSLRLQNVEEQLKLREMQGREEIEAMKAQRGNPSLQKWYLEDERRRREGQIEGFVSPEDPSKPGYGNPTSEAVQKFRSDVQGAGHTMIDSLQRAKQMIHEIHDAEAHGETQRALKLRADYKSMGHQLLTPWRIYSRSGANISGIEKDSFDNTMPSFFRVISGVGNLMEDEEGLNMAEYMIVNNIKNTGTALAGGTAVFDPNYKKYAPSMRWAAGQRDMQGIQERLRAKREMYRGKYKEKHKYDLVGHGLQNPAATEVQRMAAEQLQNRKGSADEDDAVADDE